MHRCFPVNFAEFLRTHFLQNTSGRLLLLLVYFTPKSNVITTVIVCWLYYLLLHLSVCIFIFFLIEVARMTWFSNNIFFIYLWSTSYLKTIEKHFGARKDNDNEKKKWTTLTTRACKKVLSKDSFALLFHWLEFFFPKKMYACPWKNASMSILHLVNVANVLEICKSRLYSLSVLVLPIKKPYFGGKCTYFKRDSLWEATYSCSFFSDG